MIVTDATLNGNVDGAMSAELCAIIAAAVSLGGLVTIHVAELRSRIDSVDACLRTVESDLAFLKVSSVRNAAATPRDVCGDSLLRGVFPDACTFEMIEAAVGEQAQERFGESVQKALLET